MTVKKPGHSQSRGNSASASIHKGTPEIQEGPEGHSEDEPSWNNEDDQNKTLYANLSIRRAKTWLRTTGNTDFHREELVERTELPPRSRPQ